MSASDGRPVPGSIVRYQGDTWRVLGVGSEWNGAHYLHLASTTRHVQERNGARPIQMADFIAPAELEAVQS